jgi:two-component system, sporulation sensor kinase D
MLKNLLPTIKRIRQFFRYRSIDIEELIENNARMKEMLEERSRLEDLGALAASIEHDVKTPLTSMSTIISSMERKFQHDSNIINFLSRLRTDIHRIAAIIRITSIVRADTDFYERHMSKTSLVELIHKGIKAVKNEMDVKHILFKQDVRLEYFINAHPMLLEQAVVNILRNSVEAINRSNLERGYIHIRSKLAPESNDHLIIEISDNGCGIPDEYIDKLTSLFTTKGDRKPIIGLGLFVAKKITKIHRGKLEIKSKVGEGTVVSLILPRC